MGYRSDLRFRIPKKDYYELVESYNKESEKQETTMSNLFGKTPTNDIEIVEFGKEQLEVIEVQNNYKRYDNQGNAIFEDMVYFGWSYLKWYEDYEDVSFIMDFITGLDVYAYARLGEDYGDIEEMAENLDYIGIIRGFDDVNECKNEEDLLF